MTERLVHEEEQYLHVAQLICGERSSRHDAQGLVRLARQELNPEEWKVHWLVVETLLKIRERKEKQQEQQTTLNAIRYLLTDSDRWPEMGWVPFSEALTILTPVLSELILLDRLVLGVCINGWQPKLAAGFLYDIARQVKIDAADPRTLDCAASWANAFVDLLVREIEPRVHNSAWIKELILARNPESDFLTWKLAHRPLAHAATVRSDGYTDDAQLWGRMLKSRASDARKFIRKNLSAEDFRRTSPS